MNSYIKYLLVSIFLLTQATYAQNIEKDLERLSDLFTNSSSVSVELKYKIFKNHDVENSVEEWNGLYLRSGKSQYNELGQTASYQNDQVSLAIDYNSKEMIVGNAEPLFSFLQEFSQFEDVINEVGSIEFKESEGKKIYWIEFPAELSPAYEKVRMVINKTSGFYDQIDFYHRNKVQIEPTDALQKPRICFEFNNIQINEPIHDQRLKSNYFISGGNGEFKAQPNFKSYQIINQYIALKH